VKKQALPTYRKAILQIVAYRRIQLLVGAALKRFQLNTTQWIVLGLLHDSPKGMRVTDVAKALHVEMPLITTLAQALISAGLIESVAHTKDRRAKMLLLTEAGKAKVDEVEEYLDGYLEVFRGQINEDDLEQYFILLEKFMNLQMPHQLKN
jgi:DNA-binding MarR family transcriptional regulator